MRVDLGSRDGRYLPSASLQISSGSEDTIPKVGQWEELAGAMDRGVCQLEAFLFVPLSPALQTWSSQ